MAWTGSQHAKQKCDGAPREHYKTQSIKLCILLMRPRPPFRHRQRALPGTFVPRLPCTKSAFLGVLRTARRIFPIVQTAGLFAQACVPASLPVPACARLCLPTHAQLWHTFEAPAALCVSELGWAIPHRDALPACLGEVCMQEIQPGNARMVWARWADGHPPLSDGIPVHIVRCIQDLFHVQGPRYIMTA